MTTLSAQYPSPIGTIEIVGSEAGIRTIRFLEASTIAVTEALVPECLIEGLEQLDEYFRGVRREFSLPLDANGTEFEHRVWNELLQIPFSHTCTYMDVATSLGDRNAIRAVGAANGRNPIAIIVPCHRVIGSDGTLTGYAGGLWRKQWLLEHEGASIQTAISW